MRGPKLNEGATAIGERHGTKATAKYVRSSASKARIVLDLVRGLDVKRADEVLQFTERGIAKDIRKVLASAVANASNPDNTGSFIGDPDELFVLACFADEGPTLKRFAARARGRGTRIRKRTCHITVVVARMSADRLAVVQARNEGVSANTSASRRARVERSRTRAQAAKAAVNAPATAQPAVETDAVETDAVETDAVETDAVETDAVETDAVETEVQGIADVTTGSDTEPGSFAAGEWAGSVVAAEDGTGPDSHPIKGNADSMLYHTPDSRYYKVTKAEVWFDTEEHAEAAGFSKPGSQTTDESAED
jgi:large subunit ribosomal protein L22